MWRDFDSAPYEEEVQQRWGDTAAYAESKQRTARYGKREWDAIRAERGAVSGRGDL